MPADVVASFSVMSSSPTACFVVRGFFNSVVCVLLEEPRRTSPVVGVENIFLFPEVRLKSSYSAGVLFGLRDVSMPKQLSVMSSVLVSAENLLFVPKL